jgi:pimeloyl-ACP methyl ester carboxylesterase
VRLADPRGLQRRLLYFPSRLPVPPSGELIAGARDLALRTDDGLRLGAWLVPGCGPGLGEVEVPVTVVYGTRDSIIPPDQSLEVARAARGPVRTVRIPGADHNDPALVDGPQVVGAVVEMAELVRRER